MLQKRDREKRRVESDGGDNDCGGDNSSKDGKDGGR